MLTTIRARHEPIRARYNCFFALLDQIEKQSKRGSRINFRESGLHVLRPPLLGELFIAIPQNITSLDLSFNALETISFSDLSEIFQNLPFNITTLDLSHNFELSRLEPVLKILPVNIKTLILRQCVIQDNDVADLSEIFKALPREITSLDLSGNHLYRCIMQNLDALQFLPPGLTSLYLNSFLNQLRKDELGILFSKLPDSITSLYLEGNQISADKNFTSALSRLGSNITSLYLGKNELYKTELSQVLASLPLGVTSLHLDSNRLGDLPTDELIKAFKAMSPLISSLNLSYNFLFQKNTQELCSIFQSLPNGITTLTLDAWDISRRSEEDLIVLGKALPHVMNVRLIRSNSPGECLAALDKLKLHIGSRIRELDAQIPTLLREVPNPVCDIITTYATNTDTQERKSFIHEQDRERECKNFSSHLEIIRQKADSLYYNNYVGTSYELYNLHNRLRELKDQYCQGKITRALFKEQALPEIKRARPILAIHRGNKDLYVNLLLFILGLGMIYALASAYRGSLFFKVNTDSENKLNALENALKHTGI